MNASRVDRFWAVWRLDGNSPTTRHSSKALACEEASRLAAKHPGSVFYVLEVVGAYAVPITRPQFFGIREGDIDPLDRPTPGPEPATEPVYGPDERQVLRSRINKYTDQVPKSFF